MAKTMLEGTNMLFVDYQFHTAFDGSIIMDEELKPSSLGVKEGDTFVVRINDGHIVLEKQKTQDGPPNILN
jgi:formylmethanofuran dehydrogenase subunit D